MEVSGKLSDLSKEQQIVVQDTSINTQSHFALPKIQLPTFYGKPTEWKRFIGLFDRMVHLNSQIDNGLKIEYLKTCIKGDAARVINHVQPDPQNYLTCYNILSININSIHVYTYTDAHYFRILSLSRLCWC